MLIKTRDCQIFYVTESLETKIRWKHWWADDYGYQEVHKKVLRQEPIMLKSRPYVMKNASIKVHYFLCIDTDELNEK
jgi:hypothetical protein